MFDENKLICPFWGGAVRITVCDDEGNDRSEEYESDPWSGLGYKLAHDENDIPDGEFCPVATFEDETLGMNIYDSREEAASAWKHRPSGAKR